MKSVLQKKKTYGGVYPLEICRPLLIKPLVHLQNLQEQLV